MFALHQTECRVAQFEIADISWMIACQAVLAAGSLPAESGEAADLRHFHPRSEAGDRNTCGDFDNWASLPVVRLSILDLLFLFSFQLYLLRHESAFAIARALLTVSSYSAAGSESATMPAPACTYAVPSFNTAQRNAMHESMLPSNPK